MLTRFREAAKEPWAFDAALRAAVAELFARGNSLHREALLEFAYALLEPSDLGVRVSLSTLERARKTQEGLPKGLVDAAASEAEERWSKKPWLEQGQ